MAKAISIRFLFALAISILMFSSAAAQVGMGTACEPYGSVTIEGQPAANGLLVVAFIGEIELARTHTIGGQYSLFIPKDDPATPQRDGYRDGEILTIFVNGTPATPAFEAFQGRQRRDLDIATLSIKIETWGRIKALFK
jgi:hypothetical protein